VCVRPDGGLTPPARELVAHLRRQGERAQLGLCLRRRDRS
jgi:hypothetical protein